jgi:hypothetical protein
MADTEVCAICLTEAVGRNGGKFLTNPGCCGKWFHEECIAEMIRANRNHCPTCRTVFCETRLTTANPRPVIPVDRPVRFFCKHSGLVLDVNGASMNTARIIQYPINHQQNQVFVIERTVIDPEYVHAVGYKVRCAHSGKYWDIDQASQENCASLIQYNGHDGLNQKFTFHHVADGYYRITSCQSGKVLDVDGGSLAGGVPIIQYQQHEGNNQLFRIDLV